jgi:hypothetical protein
MNMTDKNGQPSMEEILASIRRIIAEEPAIPHSSGVLRGTPITLKGDGVLEDASDFDLPAIFRSSPAPQVEKPAPLLGRLSDAIRNATSSTTESRALVNGHSLAEEDHVVDAEAEDAYPSLSSLKPVRSGEVAGEALHAGVMPAQISEKPGYAPQSQPSPSAYVAQASKPSGPEEPKRVMSAFKDTHFLKMGGATPQALPSPEPAPQVAAAPPVQAEAPKGPLDFGAIIPGQLDRAAFLVSDPSRTPPLGALPPSAQPTVASAPLAAPSVPPPLAPSEVRESLMPLAPVPATAGPVEPAAAASGDGSIEDATADLLRPMLRQWLADNMPRMVEKALHIEIAESVKRKP